MSDRRAAGSAPGRAAAALAVACALLVASAGAGRGQEGGVPDEVARAAPGMVTARTFRAPPTGFSVAVSPYDDSDLNLQLKADFQAQLAERWQARTVEEPAAFQLLFESAVVPANLAPPPPSLGSARLDDGGAEVNVNVWSSTQDSVLGGRQQEAPAAGRNVFHINAVLRDRQSGEVAWQGDAYYVLKEPDTERVARALVPPLVDRIGQSVVREPLNFD